MPAAQRPAAGAELAAVVNWFTIPADNPWCGRLCRRRTDGAEPLIVVTTSGSYRDLSIDRMSRAEITGASSPTNSPFMLLLVFCGQLPSCSWYKSWSDCAAYLPSASVPQALGGPRGQKAFIVNRVGDVGFILDREPSASTLDIREVIARIGSDATPSRPTLSSRRDGQERPVPPRRLPDAIDLFRYPPHPRRDDGQRRVYLVARPTHLATHRPRSWWSLRSASSPILAVARARSTSSGSSPVRLQPARLHVAALGVGLYRAIFHLMAHGSSGPALSARLVIHQSTRSRTCAGWAACRAGSRSPT